MDCSASNSIKTEVVTDYDERSVINSGTVLTVSRNATQRVCRTEQDEYMVQSVDDSVGRSNEALDSYDVSCCIRREHTLQMIFLGMRNLAFFNP